MKIFKARNTFEIFKELFQQKNLSKCNESKKEKQQTAINITFCLLPNYLFSRVFTFCFLSFFKPPNYCTRDLPGLQQCVGRETWYLDASLEGITVCMRCRWVSNSMWDGHVTWMELLEGNPQCAGQAVPGTVPTVYRWIS